MGPIEPVLSRLDPLLKDSLAVSDADFDDLLAFVRDALLDERAKPEHLCKLIPQRVPSGMPLLTFEGCAPSARATPAH
jgi:hypothetical protein